MARIGLTKLSENYVVKKNEPQNAEISEFGKLLYGSQYLDIWNYSYRGIFSIDWKKRKGIPIPKIDKNEKEGGDYQIQVVNIIEKTFSKFNENRARMKITESSGSNLVDAWAKEKRNNSLDLISLIEKQAQEKNEKIVILIEGFWEPSPDYFDAWGRTKVFNDPSYGDSPMYQNIKTEPFKIEFYKIFVQDAKQESEGVLDETIGNEFGDVYFMVDDFFLESRENDAKNKYDPNTSFNSYYQNLKATQFSNFTEKVYSDLFK